VSADHYVTIIERLLRRQGIRTYTFERRRKHRVVRVLRGSKTIMVTFPSSGSDWRGSRNATAYLEGLGARRQCAVNSRYVLRNGNRPAGSPADRRTIWISRLSCSSHFSGRGKSRLTERSSSMSRKKPAEPAIGRQCQRH
jgi:hypothetical protein